MSSTTRQRAPRYKRNAPAPMRLGERDIAILRAVRRYRLLRSTHLAALDGGSGQVVVRRLRSLFDHGYLDRPKAQLISVLKRHNEPMVYGLGNRGAETLARLDARPEGRLDWTNKNNRAGPLFLEHTLMTADVMVPLEIACGAAADIRLIDQEVLVVEAPAATRKTAQPLRWQADVRTPRQRTVNIGLIPDRAFSLVFEEKTRANFFLEADRATMPVVRRDLRQTSVYRKLIAYYAGWKSKRHTEQFGWQNFRVLTVTKSRERIETMLEVVNDITDGRGTGLFLFGEASVLFASNPLSFIWTDGRGNKVKIEEY